MREAMLWSVSREPRWNAARHAPRGSSLSSRCCFLDVAIIVYWCCICVLAMLQHMICYNVAAALIEFLMLQSLSTDIAMSLYRCCLDFISMLMLQKYISMLQCCKSSSRCCRCCFECCEILRDVFVDLDVADVVSNVAKFFVMFFGVANIKFQCCRYCIWMLRRKRTIWTDVATMLRQNVRSE
jgi:hypothetical protein